MIARFAGVLFVAGALAPALRSDAGACNDESYDFPYRVEAFGEVTAVSGRHFRVGEVNFELPESRSQLAWCGPADERDEDYGYERFRVGDYIGTGGSLRADGSVLAYWAYHATPDDADDPDARYASGIVQSVSGDPQLESMTWFVIDGNSYVYDSDYADYDTSHPDLLASSPDDPDADYIEMDLIAPGDTLFVEYAVDDAGVRRVIWMYSRMSGSDTVVAGTITQTWDEGNQFAVDGIPAVCDDYTTLAFRDPRDIGDPRDPDDDGSDFESVEVGQIVEVTGVLRNGVIFADLLVIVREADSPGAARLAKRAGRLRAHGTLSDVETDGTALVSGLTLRTRGRVARAVRSAMKASPVGSARRVDIVATVRNGVILASAIRRR
jgi:hypothetical protein